jgi:hypothetical protein
VKKFIILCTLVFLLVMGIVPLFIDSAYWDWEENNLKEVRDQYNGKINNSNSTLSMKEDILDRINNLKLFTL